MHCRVEVLRKSIVSVLMRGKEPAEYLKYCMDSHPIEEDELAPDETRDAPFLSYEPDL